MKIKKIKKKIKTGVLTLIDKHSRSLKGGWRMMPLYKQSLSYEDKMSSKI